MQMRSGSPAAASAKPDFLTTFDPIARLHLDIRQMEIQRQQSLPMIPSKYNGLASSTVPVLAAETGVPCGTA